MHFLFLSFKKKIGINNFYIKTRNSCTKSINLSYILTNYFNFFFRFNVLKNEAFTCFKRDVFFKKKESNCINMKNN